MWGDIVDLARCRHIDHIIGLNLNLISRRQESVKTHDEVWMAFKQLRDTVYDSGSVYAVVTEW